MSQQQLLAPSWTPLAKVGKVEGSWANSTLETIGILAPSLGGELKLTAVATGRRKAEPKLAARRTGAKT